MKTRQSRRQTGEVSHSRWAAYAAASAATALAGTNSAEAAIHYSGLLEVKFRGHGSMVKTFQLGHRSDSFRLRHSTMLGYGFAKFEIQGPTYGTVQFRAYNPGPYRDVSKLHRGQRISTGSFTSYGFAFANMAASCGGGQWRDPGIGFIGFRFDNGAGTQYGWARVRMAGCPNNNFELIDYAYADPGERIRAGQGIPRAGEDGQDISDE